MPITSMALKATGILLASLALLDLSAALTLQAGEESDKPLLFASEAEHGVVDLGDCARFRRFEAKLKPGQSLALMSIGGSTSAGAGLESWSEHYLHQIKDALNKRFGTKATVYKTAVGATGSSYYAHCVAAHLPAQADLILGEFAVNDMWGEAGPKQHYPYEDTVLETLLTNVAHSGRDPLFVSANFIAQSNNTLEEESDCGIEKPRTGLEINGYRDMYRKHGVPILSVKDTYKELQCDKRKMFRRTNRNGHPHPTEHKAIAELFMKWVTMADKSCPKGSAVELSLGADLEKKHELHQWQASKDPLHPAMQGPINCKTTLAPRKEGAFLYPVGGDESVTYAADPVVDGLETGVPQNVHDTAGWQLKAMNNSVDKIKADGHHLREDMKLRWQPTVEGIPLKLKTEVSKNGMIGMIYFEAKDAGQFEVSLWQNGQKTYRGSRLLSASSNTCHTRADVLWTGLPAGEYEVRVQTKKLTEDPKQNCIGVVGLSSA